MSEVWKAVPGWEGIYEVSNIGRVKSHHRGGRIRKLSLSTDGYHVVILHGAGRKSIGHNVHRLVCMAFHGVPKDISLEAAHLDGNRVNNTPSNLVWATRKENIGHKRKHGTQLMGEKHPRAKLTKSQVREAWLSVESAPKTATRFGVHPGTIERIRRGSSWRDFTSKLPPQPDRRAGQKGKP